MFWQNIGDVWQVQRNYSGTCWSTLCKKPVTTMLTYPWKCTVLHCNHLGNTWQPLVLMTRHFDYCPSASGSSAPVVSRCFPGGYNVKVYISRGRLAWWLLAFLCCASDSSWEGTCVIHSMPFIWPFESHIYISNSMTSLYDIEWVNIHICSSHGVDSLRLKCCVRMCCMVWNLYVIWLGAYIDSTAWLGSRWQ